MASPAQSEDCYQSDLFAPLLDHDDHDDHDDDDDDDHDDLDGSDGLPKQSVDHYQPNLFAPPSRPRFYPRKKQMTYRQPGSCLYKMLLLLQINISLLFLQNRQLGGSPLI